MPRRPGPLAKTSSADKAPRAGHPSLRHVLIAFALVLCISVLLIGGLTAIAARSQDRVAVVDSVHLTKSVLADIERRLADQLVDYSYWDEAVRHLVRQFNFEWADKNVGLYMHDKFGITSSFVVGDGNRPVYGMIDGTRKLVDPLARFSSGLDLLIRRTRAQPRTAPPNPATGLVSDGHTIHIAAASVLTTFPVEGQPKGELATDSVLIFTRALTPSLLAQIANNYLLEDLRLADGGAPLPAASIPLVGPGGNTLGHLTWRVEAPASEMLRWLLPLIAMVFLVFVGTAIIFFRKTQAVTDTLVENIAAIEASEKALRRSEEKQRTFAADVAHELRTPLALLRSQVDALGESDTVQGLRSDIDRMTRLVSQLLTATRLDWVAVGPDDRADLTAICAAVAGHLAPMALKEERSIEITGAREPVIIRGNAGAVEQAVSNLVENAIRYSARNSTVTVEVDDGPNIRVKDRGRGIEPDNKLVLFDRFRRADRRGGGAGLGLSIVSRAADIHGATVVVDDRPGGGSIFEIRFPEDALIQVYGKQPGGPRTLDRPRDKEKPPLKVITGGK